MKQAVGDTRALSEVLRLHVESLGHHVLAAGLSRKLTPVRLKAFIAAIPAVRSTRSFSAYIADAAT